MESIRSDSELNCGNLPNPQSSQQLTEHVTVRIKQEAADDPCTRNLECFGETKKDHRGNFDVSLAKVEFDHAQEGFASPNYGLQSTCNEAEDGGGVFTKLLTSTMKPVKNEEDQDGGEPQAVPSGHGSAMSPTEVKQEEEYKAEMEDHVLYKFEPGLGKREAYDEGPKGCTHADLPEYSASHKRQKKLDVNTKPQPSFSAELYRCTQCDYASKFRFRFSRHLTVKHQSTTRVYRCAKCDYATKWKPDLPIHINGRHTRHAELYKCAHCDFATKYKKSISRHFKFTHDPDAKMYACTDCDFTTKERLYLKSHLERKHNSDGPVYQCAKCGYSTKVKQNFQAHGRDKHGKRAARKVYKCASCDFTTQVRGSLTGHVTVKHNLNAPVYQCEECSYRTKVKYDLTVHINGRHREHAEVYKCPHCDFATKYKKCISRHVKVTHGPNAKASPKCPSK